MKSELHGNKAGRGATLPVDGHVHFHVLERVDPTLDAAAANFQEYGGRRSGCAGALLLTQANGERVFEALRGRSASGRWEISPSPGEDESLLARHGELSVIVVCGRQVRCERGLEVTALGTTREFPDGRPLADTIREVQSSGALACLPWGFGKWTGARGGLVRDALQQNAPESLAVCDNGSRLEFLGRPELIREADTLGFQVLPGTDPFPIGDDYRRAGSFGFLAEPPGPTHPWRDLRDWLCARDDSPPAYGRALGLIRFLVNNVGIQVRNRRRRA